MEADIQRGFEAGFDYHVTKPVDLNRLRSLLDAIAL
jgi:CheY-like chemotaxis protein